MLIINNLSLVNFRNYSKAKFEFAKNNLVIGANGTGKSNILEAIFLLATGKSFRADTDTEMIRHEERIGDARCQISDGDTEILLRVILTDGTMGGIKKKFEVNGVARRQIDTIGKLRVVMFAPTDMEIVTGSPVVRRKYLDFVITQADRDYRRCLLAYEKGLRQRNKLLDLIRDGAADRHQLFFWDKTLIKNGQYITDKRGEFLARAGFIYDKSEISELRLKQYEQEELMAGSTLVGPHRDNFILMWAERDVSKFGSRGEQRMAVWWLKQKEIEYLSHFDGASRDERQPILLLDDIFSELDTRHRAEVTKYIKNYPGQTIMTSAEENLKRDIKFDELIKLPVS